MKLLPFALLLLLTGCQHTPSPTPTKVSSVTVTPPQPGSASWNLNAGDSFLQANAARAGVVTTASGLQYQVLESGPAGRAPTRSDTVKVHYRGTLTDGTVFDSSIDRGVPATFGVGQVIPGWTEALQLMKPGDKWMLFIPSRLAYGERAMGDKIPANSTLIFRVELLDIVGAG
ncbi:MAG: FKBP-type peptidyl-prolyl cis-trans isomerase [Prosthecobacter sp.]|nr:FKBP-type peptidyl-prolyl cis-trans isomerase [Prosthecobacter sp.]